MVELKNTSKAVVIFYGLLANGQAIVFMPEQTLEFAESVLRPKWQKFIAKWNSDVQVTKIDGVEPPKAPQDPPKPKTQKPATATPAENKEGTPASPSPANPTATAGSSATGQPTSPAAPVTNPTTQQPPAANPAPTTPPKEGSGKPTATDSAAANGGVSDEGLAAILNELGD